jgi:uracil-DNA glycosylase
MTDWDMEAAPEWEEGGGDEGGGGNEGDGDDVASSDSPSSFGETFPVFEDPRQELRALVRAAAALIEQHRDGGTVGFPKRPRPARVPQAQVPAAASEPGQRNPQEQRDRFAPPTTPTFREAGPRTAAPPARQWQETPVEIPRPSFEIPDRPVARAPSRPRPVAFERVPPEARVGRLEIVNQRVQSCTACVLHETRTNTVFARGNPQAEICFLGEGPGADEDASGSPFVGPAGQLLDRMIVAMGYQPDDVYICNIVKCRPPKNRKPSPDEMASCVGYVQEQLGIVAPRVIVALGGTAMEGLFGSGQGGITRIRGQWKLYQAKIPVMPTFHPAYLLRQPTEKAKVWADLQQVVQHLGRSIPKRGT